MISGAKTAIRINRITTMSAPIATLSDFSRRPKSSQGERAAISPGGGPPTPIPPNAPPSLSSAASGVPVVKAALPRPRCGRGGSREAQRNGGPSRRILLRSGGSLQRTFGAALRDRSGNVLAPIHGTRRPMIAPLLRDKNALGSLLLCAG